MATITPTKVSEVPAKKAFAASAPSGDEVVPLGNTTIVEFKNTHASSITVTLTAQITAYQVQGVGAVSKGNQSVALAQNEEAIFVIENPGPYMNSNGRLAFSYTSGDAEMLLRAVYH